MSRRKFWRALAGLSAATELGARRTVLASPPTGTGDPDPSALLPKLLNRITFGLNQTDLAAAAQRGYSGYIDYQLDYQNIADTSMPSRLRFLTTLAMAPVDLYAMSSGQVLTELIDATIIRAIFSQRQLYERMVEFWTDHFNIDIQNGQARYLKTVDDRDVIRPNALGFFPQLLAASVASPAMMYYLDNALSTAGAINENYARELMELHTLGVDGGYSQRDVNEVARCLTGWGAYPYVVGDPLSGTLRFRPEMHDNGSKLVLGHVIPEGGGQNDAAMVVQILANHPSTAMFIARKLCKRFLSYTPPDGVVKSVAAVYTATGGDIKAMVRKVLAPEHLADAPLKFKRPLHACVSALRSLSAECLAGGPIRQQLQLAGHVPMSWGPPDGYPDSIDFWSGLILPRWNYGALMVAGSLAGVTVNPGTLFAGLTTADQIVSRLNSLMFGGGMPESDAAALRAYLAPDPTSLQLQKDTIGLAVASPGFQWY
ncbi:MAG: DUF1800 domain-containing protein [Planctomycetes bacterium]|nr:DUF1800 domain-containing protein [Planctomycetota bacterium]